MIATTRRMAIHDFLLIAVAVTVIGLSLAHPGAPQQSLDVRHRDGRLQRYTLSVDDPRLATIQRRLANPTRPAPIAALITAKWRAEAADFYVQRCREAEAKQAATIAQVSYREPAGSNGQLGGLPSAAQSDYWIGVRDQANATVTAIQQWVEQQQRLAEPPPVSFGPVVAGSLSIRTFLIAALAGLAVSTLMAIWTFLCPAIKLQSDLASEVPGPARNGNLVLPLVIPAAWVRVHQPWPATARKVVYGAIVVVAAAAAIGI